MKEIVCKDMNGEPIHEGDRVMGFEQRYHSTLVGHGSVPGCDDELPIYEIDTSKPLPSPDVPLFRGQVYWSEDMLAYWIKLDWVTEQWNPSPCCLQMGGAGYSYQLVK